MDETTFPFSKKVLDRANTIELSYVDFAQYPIGGKGTIQVNPVGNDYLKADYLQLMDCNASPLIEEVSAFLNEVNDVLAPANAQVAYRIRDEIVYYLVNNEKQGGLLSHNNALDFEIMQKILPRITGSSQTVKLALEALDRYLRLQGEDRYPLSTEKIAFMMKRFEEDGFTSYWL
jgi:hypothetical protein